MAGLYPEQLKKKSILWSHLLILIFAIPTPSETDKGYIPPFSVHQYITDEFCLLQ
jgi:hypothetical protein